MSETPTSLPREPRCLKRIRRTARRIAEARFEDYVDLKVSIQRALARNSSESIPAEQVFRELREKAARRIN